MHSALHTDIGCICLTFLHCCVAAALPTWLPLETQQLLSHAGESSWIASCGRPIQELKAGGSSWKAPNRSQLLEDLAGWSFFMTKQISSWLKVKGLKLSKARSAKDQVKPSRHLNAETVQKILSSAGAGWIYCVGLVRGKDRWDRRKKAVQLGSKKGNESTAPSCMR